MHRTRKPPPVSLLAQPNLRPRAKANAPQRVAQAGTLPPARERSPRREMNPFADDYPLGRASSHPASNAGTAPSNPFVSGGEVTGAPGSKAAAIPKTLSKAGSMSSAKPPAPTRAPAPSAATLFSSSINPVLCNPVPAERKPKPAVGMNTMANPAYSMQSEFREPPRRPAPVAASNAMPEFIDPNNCGVVQGSNRPPLYPQAVCYLHGKTRFEHHMIQVKPGVFRCTYGHECKGQENYGPPLENGTAICSVHKKERASNLLEPDGLGGMKCMKGKECKGFGPGFAEPVQPGQMPTNMATCFVHGKIRKKQFMEYHPPGKYKCKPDFPCKMPGQGH